jgi:8-oxo-dGTP pyrophosphatase MutT (NUDIX family)
MIRSAGGVVWRRSRSGHVEVLIVHRLRQDDWSLPKGKLLRKEPPLVGALREVREETGLLCVATAALPALAYVDRRDRDRCVHFWMMTPLLGEFLANAEVDRVRWLGVDKAAAHLTHRREVVVLHAARSAGLVAA